LVFIGCGSQPRNTIGSLRFAARSTWASMPCSLDSTIWNFWRPNLPSLIMSMMSRLPSLPGSMP
jgi:hypothetical protein